MTSKLIWHGPYNAQISLKLLNRCLVCKALEYSVKTTIYKYIFAALIENYTKVPDVCLFQLAIFLWDILTGLKVSQYLSSEELCFGCSISSNYIYKQNGQIQKFQKTLYLPSTYSINFDFIWLFALPLCSLASYLPGRIGSFCSLTLEEWRSNCGLEKPHPGALAAGQGLSHRDRRTYLQTRATSQSHVAMKSCREHKVMLL